MQCFRFNFVERKCKVIEEEMLGSQMKWAKFLSANLPKVEETNQNKEEKEELNEEVYKFKNTIFLSG